MIPLRDTNPSKTVPFINYILIAINCIVFLFELTFGERLDELFQVVALVPASFLSHLGPMEIATIYTSMFLHGGWMHLISNMWALFIFGDNIEDRLGHFKYLLFYLLCGTAAALTQVFMSAGSMIPTVGASGAIAGVLGGYILLFPHARVVGLLPLGYLTRMVEVPALVYLGFWFGTQFFTGVASLGAPVEDGGGGIAWWAHIGGFAAGLVMVKIFEKRERSMAIDNNPNDRYY